MINSLTIVAQPYCMAVPVQSPQIHSGIVLPCFAQVNFTHIFFGTKFNLACFLSASVIWKGSYGSISLS